jgi:2-polyprenyl-3-methyl-5-hydroxy-6-metoxy-1,4-benzoquinol methylase
MKNKMDVQSVKKNQFGFYELVDKPSPQELADYYERKYYQVSERTQKEYSASEIKHIQNKLEQRYTIAQQLLPKQAKSLRFLDAGCGEGWALQFFQKKGWDILGLDFGNYGCRAHNPQCLPFLKVGDLYQLLQEQIQENQSTFHCIWLDNVLEHVLDPQHLLKLCHQLLHEEGVLVIDVPNDFSCVQEHLLQTKQISRPFWIAIPDHISYFNREGLLAICNACGLNYQDCIADYPIDFNLFNPLTNYVEHPETGKACHHARVEIDNLLCSISMEETNALYRSLQKLGLGRSLIAFFTKNLS